MRVESIDFLGKAISVIGMNGPEETIIDGNHSQRVVIFETGEQLDSILEGLTLQNGFVTDQGWPEHTGGAILCRNTSPTIKNCIIKNSEARSGGRIYTTGDCSPMIVNTIIIDNKAVRNISGGNGGGLTIRDGASHNIAGLSH